MEELPWRMLNLAAKRGYIGANREDFFHEIRGVMYDTLERAVLELERGGLITVQWLSDSRFIVLITDKGATEVRGEYERRLKAYEERIVEQKKKAGLARV